MVDRKSSPLGDLIVGAFPKPDPLHHLVSQLWNHRRSPGDPGSGGGLRINGVVFAQSATGGWIRVLDRHDRQASSEMQPVKPCTEQPGSLVSNQSG